MIFAQAGNFRISYWHVYESMQIVKPFIGLSALTRYLAVLTLALSCRVLPTSRKYLI